MKASKLLLAVTGFALVTASARANLIVYEPYGYGVSSNNPNASLGLNGGNGLPYDNTGGNPSGSGTGLRSTWNGTVASGSLSYSNLTTSSNSLSVGANVNQNNAGPWVYRNMTTDPYSAYRSGANALGASGTTLYGSMLVQMSGIASGDRFWLRLTGNNDSYNHLTIYTADGGNWSIMQINDGASTASGTSLITNSAVAPSTSTTMLLWQQDFDFSVGKTKLSLWVNPNLSSVGTANYVFTSASNSLTNIGVNLAGLGYRTGTTNTAIIDEFRIGTAMEDVIPVPEPSTWALLAGGAALVAVVRFRRRQR